MIPTLSKLSIIDVLKRIFLFKISPGFSIFTKGCKQLIKGGKKRGSRRLLNLKNIFKLAMLIILLYPLVFDSDKTSFGM